MIYFACIHLYSPAYSFRCAEGRARVETTQAGYRPQLSWKHTVPMHCRGTQESRRARAGNGESKARQAKRESRWRFPRLVVSQASIFSTSVLID
jgi:hypothetical protein